MYSRILTLHNNLCRALIHSLDVQHHYGKDDQQDDHDWYDVADGHNRTEQIKQGVENVGDGLRKGDA